MNLLIPLAHMVFLGNQMVIIIKVRTNVHLNCLSLLVHSFLYSVIVFVLFSQFTMWYSSIFFPA